MNIGMVIVIILIGWIAGIVINYLADVLPVKRNLSKPICLKCQSEISIIDYLLLKQCPSCGSKRSVRSWIISILTPILFLLVWFYPPEKLGFWISTLLFVYFGIIAVIDIEHRLILHVTSLIGALIMIPIGIYWNGVINTFIGGIAGFGIMFGLYGLGILFNRFVAKIRGQTVDEEALGFGDVNLSGVLGILLGWPKIAIGLFFAIMIAGVISGIILLIRTITRTYKAFVPIPYAPFLLIAAVILIYLYR